MRVLELLDRLIAFPTVSSQSNLDLIDWTQAHLEACGFAVTRVPSPCGEKAGLIANRGGAGGVVLSGHTDVVPAEGQPWGRDPFRLTREGARLFGRGTTDMKGFVACALALAEQPAEAQGPVSIVLSWDEEVGCRGIPHMIPHLEAALGPQALCVVGEPTSLVMATGHKGKAAYRAVSHGKAGHSAMAPQFRNALHGACDLVAKIRAEQESRMASLATRSSDERYIERARVQIDAETRGEETYEVHSNPFEDLGPIGGPAGEIEVGQPEAAIEIPSVRARTN